MPGPGWRRWVRKIRGVDALDELVRAPLFRGLSRESLKPVAPALQRKKIPKGGFAWLEESPATALIIVVRGRVECSRTSPEGALIVVEHNGPGDVGGLPALLIEGAKRMTEGRTLEDTVVLTFEREAFFELLEHEPAVMRRVLDHVARAARMELQMFSDQAFLDLRSRVASKLSDLAGQNGEPGDDGTIVVKVSQRGLAHMVAASREKVNRALARLASDGLIRQEFGRITILQPEQMRNRF